MQTRDAVRREIDGMAAFFEKIAKVGRNVLIVFNDEDAQGFPFWVL